MSSSLILSLPVENGAIDPPPPSYFVFGCNLSLSPGLKSEMSVLSLYFPFSAMSLLTVLFYTCLQVPMLVLSWDFCLMAFLKGLIECTCMISVYVEVKIPIILSVHVGALYKLQFVKKIKDLHDDVGKSKLIFVSGFIANFSRVVTGFHRQTQLFWTYV